MILYNDIFQWEGLSKPLGLAMGKIRLRIFDLNQQRGSQITHIRPIIVVVSDVPGEKITVKGWAAPLATFICREFAIDPNRMTWVEHYPRVQYGIDNAKYIPEKYEAVDFTWQDDMAAHPRWRPMKSPMLDIVRDLVNGIQTP
ncbi:MAG: hypothetical protein SWH61_13640 [Thermodesulfobacteriota bacterium]|nr:hypothetical protein [Thermodesulfobacteriota bacterium]